MNPDIMAECALTDFENLTANGIRKCIYTFPNTIRAYMH